METLIRNTIKEFLEAMRVSYNQITIEEEGESIYRVNIDSEEASLLIGYHGETIHALQHLLKLILIRQETLEFSVILDIDGYRKRQEESVLNMAQRKADLVRKFGRSQFLDPMSPYFRRVIHTFFTTSSYEDITTESQGEGGRRRVVIKLKSAA